MVIWKQQLRVVSDQIVRLPRGSTILHGDQQDDEPCIWFQCDPEQAKEDHKIRLCGTDMDVPPNSKYLGTALCNGGTLVWHVWEGN